MSNPSTWPEWLREAYVDRGRRLFARSELSRPAGPDLETLSEVEWANVNARPVVRSEAELAAFTRGVERLSTSNKAEDARRSQTIHDTLAWVHGERRTAPVTGQETLDERPMLLELAAEAAEIMQESRELSKRILRLVGQDEAEAQRVEYRIEHDETVESTLRWLLKNTPDPPYGVNMPPLMLRPPIQLPDPSTWPSWLQGKYQSRGKGLLWADGHRGPAVRRMDLSEQEWQQMNTHPVVRSSEEVDQLAYEIHERLAGESVDEYDRGIYASTAWVVGAQRAAPVTDHFIVGDRPMWLEIAAEIDAAEEVLDRGPGYRGDGGYQVGVETALMWLIGDGERRPL